MRCEGNGCGGAEGGGRCAAGVGGSTGGGEGGGASAAAVIVGVGVWKRGGGVEKGVGGVRVGRHGWVTVGMLMSRGDGALDGVVMEFEVAIGYRFRVVVRDVFVEMATMEDREQ